MPFKARTVFKQKVGNFYICWLCYNCINLIASPTKYVYYHSVYSSIALFHKSSLLFQIFLKKNNQHFIRCIRFGLAQKNVLVFGFDAIWFNAVSFGKRAY